MSVVIRGLFLNIDHEKQAVVANVGGVGSLSADYLH